MAAPTYTTDLTTITDAESGTFTEPTGALLGSLLSGDTDNFIQNTKCTSKSTGASGAPARAGIGFLAGAAQSITTPSCVYVWVFTGAGALIDTFANGGIRLIAGSSSANYKEWYVLGKDTFPYVGWTCIAVDPSLTADFTQGSPDGTLQYFGADFSCLINISKGNPMAIDAIRHGRVVTVLNGEAANFATFAGIATENDTNLNRWGQFQAIPGGYQLQGKLQLGSAGTIVDFRDSNVSLVTAVSVKVAAGFNEIEILNASSRVDWTAVSWTALGTVSRGQFTVTDNADVNISGCSFTGLGTFLLKSNTGLLDSILRSCDTITANGAVLNGTQVLTSRVAADESALLWNVSDGDPDGNLDDMTFSKGTNAHHAISLTPNAATTAVTLRRITFTGFNATNEQNDSVLELEDRGADTTWNINTVGTTGTVSYKKRRGTDTVNIISNPVTLTVTVVDLLSGDPIQNVNVLVEAAAGGPLSVGTDIIKALTDINGEVADTRTYASNQPITGRARLASAGGPLYKTGSIAGIINSVNGLSLTVQMILDT